MNRRQFIKCAAISGLCLIALNIAKVCPKGTEEDTEAIGPKLKEGLEPKEINDVPCAMFDGEIVLTTDKAGLKLLELANGKHSLAHLAAISGLETAIIADFYLALGHAGWLANRLEVYKYAVEA